MSAHRVEYACLGMGGTSPASSLRSGYIGMISDRCRGCELRPCSFNLVERSFGKLVINISASSSDKTKYSIFCHCIEWSWEALGSGEGLIMTIMPRLCATSIKFVVTEKSISF